MANDKPGRLMRCSKRNGDLVLINPYWVREITTLDEGEPAYTVRYHDGSEQIVFQLPVDAAAEWAAAMHGDPAAEPVAEAEAASEGLAPDGKPKVQMKGPPALGTYSQCRQVMTAMVAELAGPERMRGFLNDFSRGHFTAMDAWVEWVK